MKASELKIGYTFKKQGYSFVVQKITSENYRNGMASLMVECTTNGGKIIDSVFHFKPETKIK
jgi:hypothetical protein